MPTSIRDREVRLDPVEADGEVSSDEEPSIEKVSSMPGCFVMRRRELPITVNLRKNKCSIDGAVKKKNKCKHLNDAGDVVGLSRVDKDKTYVRNLSVLRKNKRSDKSKNGKKQPRKYDILPAHASGSNEEDMQVEVHELMAHFEIPNVNEGLDAVIEDVIEEGLLRLSEDEYVISPQRPVPLSPPASSPPARSITSSPPARAVTVSQPALSPLARPITLSPPGRPVTLSLSQPSRTVTLSLSQPSRPVTSPPVTRKRRNNIVAPEMTTANKKPRVGSGKGGKKISMTKVMSKRQKKRIIYFLFIFRNCV